MEPELVIVGDYNAGFPPHVATDAALQDASRHVQISIKSRWVRPTVFDTPLGLKQVEQCTGIWIAPGSPYSSLSGTLAAIRVARTSGIPLLGTCGGFQHVILEFARNVLGFEDAHHAEYDPYASRLIVSKLACSLAGRTLEIALELDSRVAAIYGRMRVSELYYCNFGVNPEYATLFRSATLTSVGFDAEREIRIVEIAEHPFYVATLFVPQMQSSPQSPHPLIVEFVRQAAQRDV